MSDQTPLFFEFGPFRVDSIKHLLLRDGQPISVPPKVFETLLILVQRSGQVVEKDEFMSLIWTDTFVQESNLTQNVFMLRKVLGESSSDHPYIETVPRRGYRFISSVTATNNASSPRDVNISGNSAISAGVATSDNLGTPITSLAVLPLFNESDEPGTEYLSDGITESIVNILSRLPDLHVMACSTVFRYRGQEVHPQEVGRELGVLAVVVGRILKHDQSLIIRMELVDVENGWQLWGEQYDQKLTDLFQIQERIAENITKNLHLSLSGEEQEQLFKPDTNIVAAYQLYLKGRYFLNKRTKEGSKKAIEFFQQAINVDGGYALAYSGLADSYVSFDFYGLKSPWETVPLARAAASMAVELADMRAEAHTSMGRVKMIYDRDLTGAESEFTRAIELNPRYAQAHNGYSHCLTELDRASESFVESKLALELDPLDLDINLYLGWHYLHAARYDEAITQLQKTLELGPDYYRARLLLGMAYEQIGEITAAIAEFEYARSLEETPILSGFLGQAYALAGRNDEALQLLDKLIMQSRRTYVPPFGIALIYTGLGQLDQAFEWLEKALVEQSHWRGWLRITPEFDTLRSDPRFADLMRRIKLQG